MICEFKPFHTLLETRSEEDFSRYWALCGAKTEASFSLKERIAVVRGYLKATARARLILFCEDREAFLIHLWAALLENIPVVFPQTVAPAFLQDLLGDSDGVYSEGSNVQGDSFHPLVYDWSRPQLNVKIPKIQDLTWTIDPSSASLSFFSSGSSGEPKLIHKTLAQLEKEVSVLDALWGQEVWAGPVVSFVPPYHLYGFLFSVLWPLSRGQPVLFHSLLHWSEVWNAQGSGSFIVATPSHLSRMGVTWDQGLIRGPVKIFSSASPLSYESAQAVQKLWGALPIEIYGSTETGGIGFREQNAPNTPWTFLPGVSASQDDQGGWWVHSPFLEGISKVLLGDELQSVSHGFYLGGRRDRIVKIEGKRTSLEEVEGTLMAHPLIEASYVVPLVLHRECLGAVLVFSTEGKSFVEENGIQKAINLLKRHVGNRLHPALVPRRWKVSEALLGTSMGKVNQETLMSFFDLSSQENISPIKQDWVYEPTLMSVEQMKNEKTCPRVGVTLKIPSNLYYFQGHFADFPLVPGVVLFHWTVVLAERFFEIKGPVLGARKIKFMAFIRPEEIFLLTLAHDPERGTVSYKYEKGDAVYASGEWTSIIAHGTGETL